MFTWSASGAIITEALASSFATIVVYIIDTARSTSPVTFMSNMLYACSILYKTKLPFIVVLNKVSIIIVSLCNSIKNLLREEKSSDKQIVYSNTNSNAATAWATEDVISTLKVFKFSFVAVKHNCEGHF